MPATNEYLNILIVTALDEERFVLDKEFTVSPWRIDHDIRIKKHIVKHMYRNLDGGKELHLGLTSLDGMGNPWAFSETSTLIRQISPRCVLLLGVGGGRRDLMSCGDVGFSSSIIYSSFGKMISSSLAEIIKEDLIKQKKWSAARVKKAIEEIAAYGVDLRTFTGLEPRLRTVEPVPVDQDILSIAAQLSRSKEWVTRAQEFFKKYENHYHIDYFKEHGKQTGFESDHPKAREGTIASGEWVVASDEFQKKIDAMVTARNARTKRDQRVCMFEMEAYGVGLCCAEHKIPFAMMKGISDYAGADKRQKGQKDQFRLAAICSASAFTISLIESNYLLNYLDKKYPALGWSRKACLWPQKYPQQCSFAKDEGERDDIENNRKCMQMKMSPAPQSREIYASRVFEGAQAHEYSNYLGNVMQQEASQIILIFPYKINSFLSFLEQSENDDLREKAQKLHEQMIVGDQSDELTNLAINMGPDVRVHYSHFVRGEEICANMIADGKSFFQIADRMCRVVVMNKEDQEQSWNNRAILLHLATLGLCVPTLLADKDFFGPRYFADDATYIQTSIAAEISSTLCLKYLDKSNLLIVLGRCNTESDFVGKQDSKSFQFVTDLLSYLKEAKQGNLSELLLRYKIFPSLSLLEKFEIDYKNFIPNNTLLKEKLQSATAKQYFNTLRQLECPIS